jgi:hypothetical protein
MLAWLELLTMALSLPRGAEREYLAIYGIVAIYVAALPSGGSCVGVTRDLLRTEIALRRQWFGLRLSCAYWVKDKTEARLITREVHANPGRDSGLLPANAKTAQRRVENVAAHMGIPLTEHDTVLLRARSAVAFIENQIAEAHATGQLSWFNREYRAWRLAAQQHGRTLTYREARARLRRKVFRDVLFNPVQRELFPPLPTLNLN